MDIRKLLNYDDIGIPYIDYHDINIEEFKFEELKKSYIPKSRENLEVEKGIDISLNER